MGADRDVLERGVLYKDIAARWSAQEYKDWQCMFGTSGEWTFLLPAPVKLSFASPAAKASAQWSAAERA